MARGRGDDCSLRYGELRESHLRDTMPCCTLLYACLRESHLRDWQECLKNQRAIHQKEKVWELERYFHAVFEGNYDTMSLTH
jgi:hypothetical protein